MVAEPFFRATDPVGTPVPGATVETVSVNVTVWPSLEGFDVEVNLVKLDALLTVCV